MKYFWPISPVLLIEKQRAEWSHLFYNHRHPSSMHPSPSSTPASWPQDWQTGRTVSLMCYCVCVCVLEGQSHRRVSVTPRAKRLGSLASCWGSQPWLAWSVKPCQMEPFQNNERWSLWLKTRGSLLRGCRRWTFIYSKCWLVFAVFRNIFLVNNVVLLKIWFPLELKCLSHLSSSTFRPIWTASSCIFLCPLLFWTFTVTNYF